MMNILIIIICLCVLIGMILLLIKIGLYKLLIVIVCLCILIGVFFFLNKLGLFKRRKGGFKDKDTNGCVETISFSKSETLEIMKLLEAIDRINTKY